MIAALIVPVRNLLPCELFTLLTVILRDFLINFILTFDVGKRVLQY